MKSVFLGLGKVNRAIAAVVGGDRLAFIESGGNLLVSEFKNGNWTETKKIQGSFDTYDWTQELPAQVFISPGVDPRRPFFEKLKKFEVRELDLFCERFQGQIIGITGTDGKSTFCYQMGEVLKRSLPNKKIFIGGNLGTGMFEALSSVYDISVLEISSFQAERLQRARLDYGVLLNLAVDHLDRYNSLKDYHDAKWNLLKMSANVIYPVDTKVPNGFPDSKISFKSGDSHSELLKKFVLVLAKDWNFNISDSAFENLPRLPHRREILKDREGKVFVNDSKATTVHAVLYALREFQQDFSRIKLILGGQFKGDDFSPLVKSLRPQDEVFLYGQARQKIREGLEGCQNSLTEYSKLENLLEKELPKVQRGECFLLSPGCSSYDEFENFEKRGDFFRNAVRRFYNF